MQRSQRKRAYGAVIDAMLFAACSEDRGILSHMIFVSWDTAYLMRKGLIIEMHPSHATTALRIVVIT